MGKRTSKELLERIDRFSKLKANWDGEDALPIDNSIIELSKDVLKEIESILKKEKCNLDIFVYPTWLGGIQFEMDRGCDKFIAIELERKDSKYHIHYLKDDDEDIYVSRDNDYDIALVKKLIKEFVGNSNGKNRN